MGGVGLAVLCLALVLAPSRAVLVAGVVFAWLFAVSRGAAC